MININYEYEAAITHYINYLEIYADFMPHLLFRVSCKTISWDTEEILNEVLEIKTITTLSLGYEYDNTINWVWFSAFS